jgi:hypothetical protein
MLFVGDPMTPKEIVTLFLDGIRARDDKVEGETGR